MPITALSTTSVTYTTPQITWNQYVAQLGGVPAPASARVWFEVHDVSMDRPIVTARFSISSGEQVNTQSLTQGSLSAKTSYYVEVAVTATGIPDQVFARRCFMTGGTYTMDKAPGTTHENNFNSGCYSISPLTMQHVRNCWCGRKTTLPLFSSTQDNTDFLNRWGCR